MNPEMLKASLTVTLAAFAIVVLGGCGGGADDSADTGNASRSAGEQTANGDDRAADDATTADGGDVGVSSRQGFIQAANAACNKSRARIDWEIQQLIREKSDEKGPAALARELVDGVVAPGLEQQIADIRAESPPPADSKQVEAILSAVQAEVDRAEQDPLGFVRAPRQFRKSEVLGNRYGLTACGRL